jgi:hypothetical protein
VTAPRVDGHTASNGTKGQTWVDPGITVGHLFANLYTSQTAYTTFPKYGRAVIA